MCQKRSFGWMMYLQSANFLKQEFQTFHISALFCIEKRDIWSGLKENKIAKRDFAQRVSVSCVECGYSMA